ncbi:hypothetical protein CDAR_95391 [Caerostris darwini]|uniref:Uncharacterized protein n=1 Tax=Caerostris darwini TaxID=1538125 RepID=A0AAV4PJ04_9ARAC|nr:hypothetical protein CDAR_95391 [Caerostris darwini]
MGHLPSLQWDVYLQCNEVPTFNAIESSFNTMGCQYNGMSFFHTMGPLMMKVGGEILLYNRLDMQIIDSKADFTRRSCRGHSTGNNRDSILLRDCPGNADRRSAAWPVVNHAFKLLCPDARD